MSEPDPLQKIVDTLPPADRAQFEALNRLNIEIASLVRASHRFHQTTVLVLVGAGFAVAACIAALIAVLSR